MKDLGVESLVSCDTGSHTAHISISQFYDTWVSPLSLFTASFCHRVTTTRRVTALGSGLGPRILSTLCADFIQDESKAGRVESVGGFPPHQAKEDMWKCRPASSLAPAIEEKKGPVQYYSGGAHRFFIGNERNEELVEPRPREDWEGVEDKLEGLRT